MREERICIYVYMCVYIYLHASRKVLGVRARACTDLPREMLVRWRSLYQGTLGRRMRRKMPGDRGCWLVVVGG